MITHDEAEAEARRERGRALIRKANAELLLREYRAAGVAPLEAAPGIKVSLELANNLRGNHT